MAGTIEAEAVTEAVRALAPPVSFALVDVDGFAEANRELGRAAADAILADVVKTLAASLPEDAFVARVGGDEFACALPDTAPEEALILLEEIRQHLAGRRSPSPVHISAGIAALPQHVSDPSDLREAADAALHRAKRDGRARVAIYVEDKMVLKSNYYTRAQLSRLSALSDRLGRTEASLLREALSKVLDAYRDA